MASTPGPVRLAEVSVRAALDARYECGCRLLASDLSPYTDSVEPGAGPRAASASREREDKYDVDVEFTMPDVARASRAVDRIAEQDTLELESTYYDTAELDLDARRGDAAAQARPGRRGLAVETSRS